MAMICVDGLKHVEVENSFVKLGQLIAGSKFFGFFCAWRQKANKISSYNQLQNFSYGTHTSQWQTSRDGAIAHRGTT